LLQACTHVVPLHVAEPPVGFSVVQSEQFAPQWLSSFATQLLPQRWSGDMHWHDELAQCSLVGHLLLQPLQLLSSFVKLTHDDPQSISDPEHPETHPYPLGADDTGPHTGSALPAAHVVLHAPQLGLAPSESVHPAPVFAQSSYPLAHWYVHFPPLHPRPAALTFGSCEQSWPHAPQLCTSVIVSPHPASTVASGAESTGLESIAVPVSSAVPVSGPVPVSGGSVLSTGASSAIVWSGEASGPPPASSPGSCTGSVPTHAPATHCCWLRQSPGEWHVLRQKPDWQLEPAGHSVPGPHAAMPSATQAVPTCVCRQREPSMQSESVRQGGLHTRKMQTSPAVVQSELSTQDAPLEASPTFSVGSFAPMI
jgi:hypothetical protein